MALGTKLGRLVAWALGAYGWKPEMESFLRTMDSVVQLNAIGFSDSPGGGNTGTLIVCNNEVDGTAPSGAFTGRMPGDIATWQPDINAWHFDTPKLGWHGYIGNEHMQFNGSKWIPFSLPSTSTFLGFVNLTEMSGVVREYPEGMSFPAGLQASIGLQKIPDPGVYLIKISSTNTSSSLIGIYFVDGIYYGNEFNLINEVGESIPGGRLIEGQLYVVGLMYPNTAGQDMTVFNSGYFAPLP
jgi:hypothetical protein